MNRMGFMLMASSAAALTYGGARVRRGRKKNAAGLPDGSIGPEERREAGRRLLRWGKPGSQTGKAEKSS